MLMREEDIPKSWIGTLVAISSFIAFAALAFLATSIVWRTVFFAIGSAEPGKPLIDFSTIVYNFSGTVLVFIALFAFYATRGQLKEAEKTRRIQVYMKIIDMWNAEDMARSRDALADFARNWVIFRLEGLCLVDDYINYRLRQMLVSGDTGQIRRHKDIVKILELLEYVGALCRREELDKTHIFDFMGSSIRQVAETFLLSYIVTTRRRYRSASNYANVLYLMEEAGKADQRLSGKFTIGGYGVPNDAAAMIATLDR